DIALIWPRHKNPAITLQKTGTFGSSRTNVRDGESEPGMLATLMCETTLRGEIARRMSRLEISVAELAKRSDVDERTIREILHGKRSRGPHMSTKRSLAHALNCTVYDLDFPGGGGEHGNDRGSNHAGHAE